MAGQATNTQKTTSPTAIPPPARLPTCDPSHAALRVWFAYCRYVTFPRRVLSGSLLALTAVVLGTTVPPAATAGFAVPVQCETSAETVLPWDDVTYTLSGTCGVVRVTADDAVVSMPAATRLVVEGDRASVTAKSLLALEVAGADNAVTTPSVKDLAVTGPRTQVTVAGLLENATVASSGSSVAADTINVLRLRGSDSVAARKAYRVRITGTANALRLRRADRLVLTGDANTVTVERGRTTVRDRGEGNVLDLRRRRR